VPGRTTFQRFAGKGLSRISLPCRSDYVSTFRGDECRCAMSLPCPRRTMFQRFDSRPAVIVAAPAAAPLSKKERRLVRCSYCSVVSMIPLSNSARTRVADVHGMTRSAGCARPGPGRLGEGWFAGVHRYRCYAVGDRADSRSSRPSVVYRPRVFRLQIRLLGSPTEGRNRCKTFGSPKA